MIVRHSTNFNTNIFYFLVHRQIQLQLNGVQQTAYTIGESWALPSWTCDSRNCNSRFTKSTSAARVVTMPRASRWSRSFTFVASNPRHPHCHRQPLNPPQSTRLITTTTITTIAEDDELPLSSLENHHDSNRTAGRLRLLAWDQGMYSYNWFRTILWIIDKRTPSC